jgi:universal stress protein A
VFPPRCILAAVDFSESSRVALDFAGRLATHCHSELHVLHAEDLLLAAAAKSAGVDLPDETRGELVQFVRRACPWNALTAHCHVVEGESVEVINAIATRESADVIVVGAHGMSGVERMLFGSTTEGVLRHSDTSVFVIPATWTAPYPELHDLTGVGPVVAGVELTPSAIAAGRAAGAIASALHTSLEVQHVVPPVSVLSRWSAYAHAAQASRMETARTQLTCALHYLDTMPAAVVNVESGPVAERLAAAVTVTDERKPLLVVGRRTAAERGGTPGSTAYRVLTLATVPVLMYLEEH